MADKRQRVALYARVSSDDQNAEGQLERLRKWALHMDMDIVGEYKETASGRYVRRPEQEKVMKLVKGHHVHAVAVAKLDRWGRSLIDLKNSVHEMVANNVKFYAVESGITYEKHTPVGSLLLNQLAAIAEFEVDLISERTKEGLQSRVAKGEAWVSKSGRTVDRLGRPLAPCSQCGGERTAPTRGKRNGKRVPLCAGCK